MHFLLALVLITADGPKQSSFEQPSLEKCWEQAHELVSKMEVDNGKMRMAGVIGFGAGCIVVQAPTQDTKG